MGAQQSTEAEEPGESGVTDAIASPSAAVICTLQNRISASAAASLTCAERLQSASPVHWLSAWHAEAHMGMQGATSTAVRLYKFNPKKKGIDSWELYAATVTPTFYDANEDSASGGAQWFLEAGELEVEVSDKFSFEESSKRATFAGESGIWALRFPSQQTFTSFVNQYNSKLFENTYKLSNDESNREKVCAASHRNAIRLPDHWVLSQLL